jgi:hypothetical protein
MGSIPLGFPIFHVTYRLIDYRARVGLPWRRVDERDLLDDPTPSPSIQLSLDSLLASY